MLDINDLKISLVEQGKGKEAVSIQNSSFVFEYPCESSDDCTEYKLTIPPGIYKFEAYGASGGYKDNYIPTSKKLSSSTCVSNDYVSLFHGKYSRPTSYTAAGSGGYTSGIISLSSPTTTYIFIGGVGIYNTESCTSNDQTSTECYVPGGYNGGGKAYKHSDGESSGGGATDFRFETNDLFHRVLVAGGGGGSDDITAQDGFGGSGGGLKTQGLWQDNQLYSEYYSDQTFGFSFGYGESASISGSSHEKGSKNNVGPRDLSGAGGGWFGGFSSHYYNGGSGGGSSFILTENTTITEDEIIVYNSEYIEIDKGQYAFVKKSNYYFQEPILGEGVWYGNGKAIITPLYFLFSKGQQITCNRKMKFKPNLMIYMLIYIYKFYKNI